jgi:hypothetical protein
LCRGDIHAREDERNAAAKRNVRIVAIVVFVELDSALAWL